MKTVLGLLILSSLGRADVLRVTLFTLQTDCSGFLFTEDVLFETDVFSELSCARLCASHANCVSFTTTPGPFSTCRGHAVAVTSVSAKQASHGAVTYMLRDDESATQAPEDTTVPAVASAYSDVSAWMGVECASDDDCTGQNTMCYQNHCLCVAGFYFSVSSDSCIDSCQEDDLGTGFTTYVDGYIPSGAISSQLSLGEQACFDFCISYSTCRAIDYRPSGGSCFPLANTAKEMGWQPSQGGDIVHYQRFCA